MLAKHLEDVDVFIDEVRTTVMLKYETEPTKLLCQQHATPFCYVRCAGMH